jgi:putative heme-binding domain-containing protein
MLELGEDPDPRVRFQVALSLGETHDLRARRVLGRIAGREDSDEWTRLAVLSSLAEAAGAMFAGLMRDDAFVATSRGSRFVASLMAIVGGRNDPAEVAEALDELAVARGAAGALVPTLMGSLGEGLKRSGARLNAGAAALTAPSLRRLIDDARATALQTDAPREWREAAVRLLGCLPFADSRETLLALLAPSQAEFLQRTAVRTLAEYDEPEVAERLLAEWRHTSPAVHAAVVQALLARESHTLAYLRAIEMGTATAKQLEPARRKLLLKHRNDEIRSLATRLFAAAPRGTRDQVIEQYRAALQHPASAARGREAFERACAACHRIGDSGKAIGPNLAGPAALDRDALLVNILDPNRFLAPEYVLHVAEDRAGRSYAGMISSETASSLTLTRADGEADTLLRSEISRLESTGISLMPEGLEGALTPPEMADLIAYLHEAANRPEHRTQEFQLSRGSYGTQPGQIEPER